ncbi:Sodium/hydrogen exchanger family-domain-containing protein [Penicillium pulvis]|uniref:Sodium/hydrogen exchanger family-domain-containing protein n=1 Tax=Penicillium pulvis TaxID=1562058 RepID=UPI0025481736|nr:Sodium/hydrogen exchanger family-domain-containing protein [Penicillium pulvis]KAJ5784883.1 Sodium/hydrogen exchanger family-domain-containing protein [Penicillium pulvis]
MAGSTDAAFAYTESSITTLLSWTAFLLALNLMIVALDKLISCGLIGQLLIGILWGTPGAKWFDHEAEAVNQKLGYLGLIMLVYESGLSTSMKSVKANLFLSICVALTGIGAPIGLSFILKELVSASSVQAFAAGAALSSTSLGTTFITLSSTELIATHLGTVTTTAAMLDDVIGLVMIQAISSLGVTDASFNPTTVIRPVFVSLGFALGILLGCNFCLGPLLKRALVAKHRALDFVATMQFAFLVQTVSLVGIVAGASYAGTSSLFAAYLAGVIVSWFDVLVVESKETPVSDGLQSEARHSQNSQDKERPTGTKVYEQYYKEPVGRIMIPLFFVSLHALYT